MDQQFELALLADLIVKRMGSPTGAGFNKL